MKIKTFCDVLQAYTCIGSWFIDSSMFDGPPVCTPLNHNLDSFCPDESFEKWFDAFETFNKTLNVWYDYPGSEGMFECFKTNKKEDWLNFYNFEVCE